MDLKPFILDVPDFPTPGVVFRDITPLLRDPRAFSSAVQQMAAPFSGRGVQLVAAPESRGFILGAAVAAVLEAGFVPLRKKGKLPRATMSAEYSLEYGKETLQVHTDGVLEADRVLIADDVLATGGTARAAKELVEQLHGKVVGFCFLIELTRLNGRVGLESHDVFSVLTY